MLRFANPITLRGTTPKNSCEPLQRPGPWYLRSSKPSREHESKSRTFRYGVFDLTFLLLWKCRRTEQMHKHLWCPVGRWCTFLRHAVAARLEKHQFIPCCRSSLNRPPHYGLTFFFSTKISSGHCMRRKNLRTGSNVSEGSAVSCVTIYLHWLSHFFLAIWKKFRSCCSLVIKISSAIIWVSRAWSSLWHGVARLG